MAHLEVLIPDRDPMIVPLAPAPLSIGRGEECDIQIPSKFVSTKHTSIELTAVVTDLGSTNGTWVGDEQVKERALRTGESFHFGWKDQVRVRLVLDEEPATNDGTAPLPPDQNRNEIAEFEALVKEQKSEIDRLNEKITGLEAARASLTGELASFTGSQIISQPVMEPGPVHAEPAAADPTQSNAELERLRDQVDSLLADLTDEQQKCESLARERDRLVEAAAEQSLPDAAPASAEPPAEAAPAEPKRSPAVDADASQELVESFAANCGLELDETLLTTMQRRSGLFEDFGYASGKLLSFSRDVEQLISAMSLAFRGTNRLNEGNVTMLPGGGTRDNLRRSIQSLLMQGGPELRSSFDGHLEHLSKWYLACVSAYKAGIEQWYPEFRRRLSQSEIERRIKVGGMLRAFGLQYREYWEAYGKVLEDLTDEIVIDEIEQAAAREAVKIAEGGQS